MHAHDPEAELLLRAFLWSRLGELGGDSYLGMNRLSQHEEQENDAKDGWVVEHAFSELSADDSIKQLFKLLIDLVESRL